MRARPAVSRSAFDCSTVTVSGHEIRSCVRLTGHLDAIDWQGTVFEALPDAARRRSSGMTLTIEDRTAAARVVEQTPWGTHMIAGVGDPPFARIASKPTDRR
jgi:hypothetical protein